jgi:CHRD domain
MSMEQIVNSIARGRMVVALAGVVVGLSATGWAVTTWRATLEPPQGVTPPTTGAEAPAVGGVATVIDSGQQKVRATIHVTNAKPGTAHPWHIHKGTCGKDQGIVGPASKYVPVRIGADGEGEVSEALPITLSADGQYMVNVHASASDLKTILACGSLQKE